VIVRNFSLILILTAEKKWLFSGPFHEPIYSQGTAFPAKKGRGTMRKVLIAAALFFGLAALPALAQFTFPGFGSSSPAPAPGNQPVDMSNVVAPVNKTGTSFSFRNLFTQAYGWPWFSSTPNLSPQLPTTTLPTNPYPSPFHPVAPIPAKN
jgi:hypothetical protein